MRLHVLFNKQRALAVMVLVSTALIVLGERVGEYVRIPAQYLMAPAGEATMYVVAGLKSHAGKSETPMPREEVEALVRQQQMLVYRMDRQLQDLRQIRSDLEMFNKVRKIRLSGQYQPTPGVAVGLVYAKVLAEDALPYGDTRLLGRGRRVGAQKGQSVAVLRDLVTDRGKALPEGLSVLNPPREYATASARTFSQAILVGRLVQPSAFSAQMALVTDPQFDAPDLYIWRIANEDPPRHILVGGHEVPLRDGPDGNNELIPVRAVGNGKEMEIQSVPADHKVQKGDWLIMPYERTYWPADILVGRVWRVEDPGTGHVKVYVHPEADLSALRDVYIMIPESNGSSTGGGGR